MGAESCEEQGRSEHRQSKSPQHKGELVDDKSRDEGYDLLFVIMFIHCRNPLCI